MKKTYTVKLCENKLDGHHKVYLNSLLKISGTYLKMSKYKLKIKLKDNPIKYILITRKLVTDYIKESKYEIFHFLVIDNIYLSFKNLKNITGIGTLHQIPKNQVKKIFLKRFVKNLKWIVVHSVFLKEELKILGIENVKVINYPSFYDYKNLNKEEIKLKYRIKKEKLVLSCLGGTRKDKGLNILLESIQYLSLEIRKKIIINIAGSEEFFTRKYIEQYNNLVDLRLELKFLSEEEFKENTIITDIMIMPYLKSFGGNSGPMTEAIVNKIPCITPKELNIGKINLKNNLGEVFECENPKSLAIAIEKIIDNFGKNNYYTTDFYKELTEQKFLEAYKKIYEEVWSELENE